MTRPFTPFRERHVAPEFIPDGEPTYTLDRQIERAKAEMGAAKWARLNAEWEG